MRRALRAVLALSRGRRAARAGRVDRDGRQRRERLLPAGAVRRDLGARRARDRGPHDLHRRGRRRRGHRPLPAVRRLPPAPGRARRPGDARAPRPPGRPAARRSRSGELLPLRASRPRGCRGERRARAARAAAQVLQERSPRGAPPARVGIVLGSGLGGVAGAVEDAVEVGYDELPGFPRPGVEGHRGARCWAVLGGVPVTVLQGRAHLYEGASPRRPGHARARAAPGRGRARCCSRTPPARCARIWSRAG